MEPSGEKAEPAVWPATSPQPQWTAKEKNDRSEWFLLAGFIGVVGLGVFCIGFFGLVFWVHGGEDLYVDIFVCSMAMFMGVLFMIVTGFGLYRLIQMKPTHLPADPDHANPRH